jgi:hypothetical protein
MIFLEQKIENLFFEIRRDFVGFYVIIGNRRKSNLYKNKKLFKGLTRLRNAINFISKNSTISKI